MNRSEMREAVFAVLRKTPQTHFRAIENDLRKQVEGYERHDILALNEVLWTLLVQGVLAPGKNSLNPDLPFVHVTEYGARCLESEEILAHDPEGYVRRIEELTEDRAPSVVLESARQGLLSFLDGRHAAGLVLLAHAAETVVNDLLDSLIRSGRKVGRGTKRLEASRLAQGGRATAALRALPGRRPPDEIAEEAETQLSGLDALLRLVRAPDGSPRIPAVERDLVRARFLLFPDQCRFAYHAIGWLDGKPGD